MIESMKNIKAQALGILRIGEDVYALLDTHGLKIMNFYIHVNDLPVYRVAKQFKTEDHSDGEMKPITVYVTPHWITPSCPYVIEWFDVMQDVEVYVEK